jgi:hypothetical protein
MKAIALSQYLHNAVPGAPFKWLKEYLKFQPKDYGPIPGLGWIIPANLMPPSQTGMKATPIAHQYLTFKYWVGALQCDLFGDHNDLI